VPGKEFVFDAGGAVTSGGFIFGTGQFVSREETREQKKSREAKDKSRKAQGKKKRKEKQASWDRPGLWGREAA
jgi:hypothetical protein